MTLALIDSFELMDGFENGITSFAVNRNELLEIFRSSLENAISSKYTDYQLDFYHEGKQIDVLNIQFVFPGKPNQTEITSFQINVGEQLCSKRTSCISIDNSKSVISRGKEIQFNFFYYGFNIKAEKSIDQKVIVALLDEAKKFFDAEEAKSRNFLGSFFSYLRLT